MSDTLVAFKKCGCVSALIVETGTPLDMLADFYKRAAKAKNEVCRQSTAEVRTMAFRCADHPKQPTQLTLTEGAA